MPEKQKNMKVKYLGPTPYHITITTTIIIIIIIIIIVIINTSIIIIIIDRIASRLQALMWKS